MKSLILWPIILALGAVAPGLAWAADETELPTAQTKLQIATEHPPAQRDEQFEFAILRAIDTSPAFSLRPGGIDNTKTAKHAARDVMNYMVDTKGIDRSKEAADVAVGKTSDIASDTTQFYQDQLHRDEIHWQVVSLIANIANALGKRDDARATAIQYVALLRASIGEAETANIVAALSGNDIERLRQGVLKPANLDLPEFLHAQDAMLSSALEADPIIASIRKDLLPYNSARRERRAATKMIYSALGIASFAPTIVAPIAETSLFGAVMANGGAEQDKLLKEVYYAKRFDKRRDLIEKELNLALNAREIAISTENMTLYHFAQQLTQYLCGEPLRQQLFPQERLDPRASQSDACETTRVVF